MVPVVLGEGIAEGLIAADAPTRVHRSGPVRFPAAVRPADRSRPGRGCGRGVGVPATSAQEYRQQVGPAGPAGARRSESTQDEVAGRAEVTRNFVRAIERGRQGRRRSHSGALFPGTGASPRTGKHYSGQMV